MLACGHISTAHRARPCLRLPTDWILVLVCQQFEVFQDVRAIEGLSQYNASNVQVCSSTCASASANVALIRNGHILVLTSRHRSEECRKQKRCVQAALDLSAAKVQAVLMWQLYGGVCPCTALKKVWLLTLLCC